MFAKSMPGLYCKLQGVIKMLRVLVPFVITVLSMNCMNVVLAGEQESFSEWLAKTVQINNDALKNPTMENVKKFAEFFYFPSSEVKRITNAQTYIGMPALIRVASDDAQLGKQINYILKSRDISTIEFKTYQINGQEIICALGKFINRATFNGGMLNETRTFLAIKKPDQTWGFLVLDKTNITLNAFPRSLPEDTLIIWKSFFKHVNPLEKSKISTWGITKCL